jgi:hypothetical protein
MRQKSEMTNFGSLIVSLISVGIAVLFFYNAIANADKIMENGSELLAILSLAFTSIFAASGCFFGMHFLKDSMTSKSSHTTIRGGAPA